MDQIKRLLALEAKQKLSDNLFDRLLSAGEEIVLPTYAAMIDAGEYDPNIYIVKKGMIRGTYLDKNLEKTAGFALPGTLLISFHCYYGEVPSYYRYEACCPTVVIRIPKKVFDDMLAESHEFALWVMSAHQNSLYYTEFKNQLLSGDSKSRLLQLIQRMEGIIPRHEDMVADMATYPSDTTSHDDRVKNELHTRWKEIFKLVPSKIIASYLGITQQHFSKIKREILTDSRK